MITTTLGGFYFQILERSNHIKNFKPIKKLEPIKFRKASLIEVEANQTKKFTFLDHYDSDDRREVYHHLHQPLIASLNLPPLLESFILSLVQATDSTYFLFSI